MILLPLTILICLSIWCAIAPPDPNPDPPATLFGRDESLQARVLLTVKDYESLTAQMGSDGELDPEREIAIAATKLTELGMSDLALWLMLGAAIRRRGPFNLGAAFSREAVVAGVVGTPHRSWFDVERILIGRTARTETRESSLAGALIVALHDQVVIDRCGRGLVERSA